MFSQLGPLFQAQFRQAESNDTRQHIPHEERDKKRKKNEERALKKSSDESWIDNASVSVVALRFFLIDFLKTLPGAEDYKFTNNDADQETLSVRPKEKNRPTSTYSAKAVRAYQTMANHSHNDKNSDVLERGTPSNKKDTAVDKLASKEIRDIHGMIMDLKVLEKKGVTTLHILKASNFVEGLKKAILKENQKFKT